MMFEKALMLAGLKKQCELLGELLAEMENKEVADVNDHAFYYLRTKAVAANLRRLRKIRRTYGFYLHPGESMDFLKEAAGRIGEQ